MDGNNETTRLAIEAIRADERARIVARIEEEAQKAEGQCATAPAMRIRVVELRRMADLLKSEGK